MGLVIPKSSKQDAKKNQSDAANQANPAQHDRLGTGVGVTFPHHPVHSPTFSTLLRHSCFDAHVARNYQGHAKQGSHAKNSQSGSDCVGHRQQ